MLLFINESEIWFWNPGNASMFFPMNIASEYGTIIDDWLILACIYLLYTGSTLW